MPIVVTDNTNKAWCAEDPTDGHLKVGWTGRPGPRLLDLLEFVSNRQKQFDQFVIKKRKEEDQIARRKVSTTAIKSRNLRVT